VTTAVVAGGVGAARFLAGLVQVTDPATVTAVVNVGDDLVLHGLHISPDLDTVTYTLAGAINPDTGWGLVDESWQAMTLLKRYGGAAWFGLGDRDLATHLFRTQRLAEGATLGDVTAEIARTWGLGCTLLPVTNDPVRTRVTLAGDDNGDDDGDLRGGPRADAADRRREVSFQEWFVGMGHAPAVSAVRFEGAADAKPGPGVLEAIANADVVVVAPSNPIVSIDPVLAVPGVRDAVTARRNAVVAVSPIVAGKALKGPAADLLRTMGHEVSVVGVARLYASFAGTLVIDSSDADLADAVADAGMRCVVAPTVMTGPVEAAALAATVLGAVP
jgi:LPPG:FO 2-phospho-L-lactate transferase